MSDIVCQFVTQAAIEILSARTVVLFGSRARGDARERSDYDFAIDPDPARRREWGRFADRVSEHAPTLLQIDLVNLMDDLDPGFRARINQEGKVLHGKAP